MTNMTEQLVQYVKRVTRGIVSEISIREDINAIVKIKEKPSLPAVMVKMAHERLESLIVIFARKGNDMPLEDLAELLEIVEAFKKYGIIAPAGRYRATTILSLDKIPEAHRNRILEVLIVK